VNNRIRANGLNVGVFWNCVSSIHVMRLTETVS